MANVKITELTAATALAGTDVLPIVDVGADATKKVSVSDLLRNLPDGTASAPALAFADDQNTGVLSPGDNSLAFATNATQQLVIDSSGNVGIGTSSPSDFDSEANNLVVGDGSGDNGITIFTGSAVGSFGSIFFADSSSGGAAKKGQIRYEQNNEVMSFHTNESERLRIDLNGRVGIGTSAPSTNLDIVVASGTATQKLGSSSVSGGSYTNYHGASGTKTWFVGSNYNVGGALEFFQSTTNGGTTPSSTPAMVIDSSGNVGIGTTSPSDYGNFADDLVIYNSSQPGITLATGTSGYGSIYFADGTAGNAASRGQIQYNHSNDSLLFATAASERLRIDSSGNVGIGTSSPTGYIHIEGASTGTETYGRFTTGSANGDQSLVIKSGSSRDHMAIQVSTNAGANDDLSLQPDGGNVGIGTTSPSSPLHVKNAGSTACRFILENSGSASDDSTQIWSQNNDLAFNTNDSERLRINSDGELISVRGSFLRDVNTGELVLAGGNATNAGANIKLFGGAHASTPDILVFRRGSSESMRIDSSGNVGIGTSSPVANTPLTLQGPSGYTDTLWLKSTGTNIDSRINFGPTGTGNAQINNATGTDIAFQVSGSEKLRIDSSGNVGIGTSSPENNLHIADTSGPIIRLSNSTGTDGSYIGRIQTGDAAGTFFAGINFFKHDANDGEIRLRTKVDGTNQDTVTIVDGRVGIGTTSPGHLLDLSSSSNAYIRQTRGSSAFRVGPAGDQASDGVILGTDTNGPLRIFTNGSSNERMRIDSSGRVLIGTTSAVDSGATSSLQVVNTSTAIIALGRNDSSISAGNDLGSIRFYGNAGGSYQQCAEIIAEADGTHANNDKPTRLVFSTTADNASSPTERMRIDSSGNAIFKNSNYVSFNDNGYIRTDSSGYLRLQMGSNGTMFTNSSNTEVARIDTSGQLLVGTSSNRSSSALQVEGTTFDTSRLSLTQNSATANAGATLKLSKSKGTSNGSFTAVSSGDRLGNVLFTGADGSGDITAATIEAFVDNTPGSNDMPGRLVFSTTADNASSPTERMRITSSGGVTFQNGNVVSISGTGSNANTGMLYVKNDSATASDCVAAFATATNSTATSNVLIKFGINSYSAGSGQINANGASQCAFGSFSDERLKENITSLPSQWDNIKNLRPVEFDFIESQGGEHQVGFIAQEFETVYPDSVGSSPMFIGASEHSSEERLTITGWSKTEARLVKALQEAIAKIETLETKVAALEAQ